MPCSSFSLRPEYYTIPSIEDLNRMMDDKGQCLVENFIVGREDYGEVKFLGETDVKGLNLDEISKSVHCICVKRHASKMYLGTGETILELLWTFKSVNC